MKRTMIFLTLFSLVNLTLADTLIEDFEDGNLHGWRRLEGKMGPNDTTDNATDWHIDKGELVVESKMCRAISVFGLGDRTWDNYEFDCQFKVEASSMHPECNLSPLFGIGVRYDDRNGVVGGATLVGGLDGNKWRVDMCQIFFERGATIKVRQGNVPIEVGKWHRAQFIARGKQYTAFIDGQPVCRFSSGVLEKSGGIVFFARNGKFHFDNIDVTGERIPEFNMNALSVSPKAKLATTWGQVKRFHGN